MSSMHPFLESDSPAEEYKTRSRFLLPAFFSIILKLPNKQRSHNYNQNQNQNTRTLINSQELTTSNLTQKYPLKTKTCLHLPTLTTVPPATKRSPTTLPGTNTKELAMNSKKDTNNISKTKPQSQPLAAIEILESLLLAGLQEKSPMAL